MKDIITLEFPTFLAECLNLTRDMLKDEIRTSAVVKLYEMGKISSGLAAKVLGISRIDFIETLNKYSITPFAIEDPAQLEEEIDHA